MCLAQGDTVIFSTLPLTVVDGYSCGIYLLILRSVLSFLVKMTVSPLARRAETDRRAGQALGRADARDRQVVQREVDRVA